MKAVERTLQQMLHSSDQYVIPVFQRYYTWDRKNWDQLWDDLLPLRDDPHPRHFMGAIVCVPEKPQPGNIHAFQVIDGQQRLTTLSILLCAIRDIAVNENWNELASEVEQNYLLHGFKKGRERFKLFPRLRDRSNYMALIEKKEPTETNQIKKAYDYQKKKLDKEGIVASEETLRRFFNILATRLDFVAITLDGESPYKIFRSLNSTGVDLEEGDLIRNQVFTCLPIDQQDTFDDEHWRPLETHFFESGKLSGTMFAAFFRDILMRKGTYVPASGVFEAFEKIYPPPVDAHRLVGTLSVLANDHDYLHGKKEYESPAIQAALKGIRALDAFTAFPLAFALMEARRDGKFGMEDLALAFESIRSFVLRRYVCGYTSKPYARWFCAAAKDIPQNGIDGLLKLLNEKGWPIDEEFSQKFTYFNLYESKYALPILAGLESKSQHKTEPVDITQCTIEHVMPQTITPGEEDGDVWIEELGQEWRRHHSEWLHCPGNLTLVGYDYNTEMRNRPFNEKKDVLMKSKVYLNKYFSEPTLLTWNKDKIEIRGRSMATIASEVWRSPTKILSP